MNLLSFRSLFSFASLVLLLAPLDAVAAAPTLTYLYPAGARRGTTVDVTAGGAFERWPVRAWCDNPAIRVEAAKDKGQLAVSVAADVVPGTYWVRLHDEQGASALRPFLVGTLPEVTEQEPNDDPKKPQILPSSAVVVNGRLGKAGDVDGFAVKLAKGQTLVASLDAHRPLGSPMDAVLQVLSPDGFVLEQNNDDRGLDPQLAFTAPADGAYVVRTFAFPAAPDSGIRFAGGDTFIYRLTLTTGGFADHAFPLAVSRSEPGQVALVGWNIPEAAKKILVRPGPGADYVTLSHPGVANAAAVRVEPHKTVVEIEPNDRQHPQPIALPVTVSGRVGRRGDVDAFEFSAKKGQKLALILEARGLGSLLDPVLRLTDAAGKQLAQADEPSSGKRGAEIAFAVPQDGAYRLEVRDQSGDGSFRHVYRLRAAFAEPDYALSLAADQFLVTPDKPLDVAVAVERRHGFAAEVEVVAEGLPPGVTAAPAKAAAGATSVTLKLTASGAPASAAVRFVGRVAGRPDLTRTASAPVAGLPATTEFVWLTLAKPGTPAVAPAPPRMKK